MTGFGNTETLPGLLLRLLLDRNVWRRMSVCLVSGGVRRLSNYGSCASQVSPAAAPVHGDHRRCHDITQRGEAAAIRATNLCGHCSMEFEINRAKGAGVSQWGAQLCLGVWVCCPHSASAEPPRASGTSPRGNDLCWSMVSMDGHMRESAGVGFVLEELFLGSESGEKPTQTQRRPGLAFSAWIPAALSKLPCSRAQAAQGDGSELTPDCLPVAVAQPLVLFCPR